MRVRSDRAQGFCLAASFMLRNQLDVLAGTAGLSIVATLSRQALPGAIAIDARPCLGSAMQNGARGRRFA